MKNRINNILVGFILSCLFVIFSYVIMLNIIEGPISLMLCVLMIFVLYKTNNYLEIKLPKYFYFILLFLAFLLFILIGKYGRVKLTWDYGKVIRSSYEYIKGIKKEEIYFARYPNNLTLYVILNAVIKTAFFLKKSISLYEIQTITIILNSIIILMSMILMLIFIKKVYQEKAFKIALLFIILFAPLYLYLPIFYTDTIAMLLMIVSIILLYLYLKETTKKKVFYFVLYLLATTIGFKLKATNIFLTLAALIVLMLENNIKEILKLLLGTGIFLLIVGESFSHLYRIDETIKEKYEFPYTHWVMMSLNEQYDGRYNEEDVAYTSSFPTKQEKIKANLSKIRERMEQYGELKLVKQIFYNKVKMAWTDPTLTSADYLQKEPYQYKLFQQIVTRKGKYYPIYDTFLRAVYLVILFGILLSIKSMWKKRERNILIFDIMLFGIFLFLLIWECNSRYLYSFIPIMVMSASYGYSEVLKEKKKN